MQAILRGGYENSPAVAGQAVFRLAPREGFEPPTKRLTAACSTTELPGNNGLGKAIAFRMSRPGDVSTPVRQGPPYIRVGVSSANPVRGRNLKIPVRGGIWRPRPESNRCARICSPLHSHSATRPLLNEVPKHNQTGREAAVIREVDRVVKGVRCGGRFLPLTGAKRAEMRASCRRRDCQGGGGWV